MVLKSKILPVVKFFARKAGSALLNVGEPLREWAVSETAPPLPSQSKRQPHGNLALIAGYFSYRDGFATFGDTEAMHVVMNWLAKAGIPFDVACHPSNGLIGLDVEALDPSPYNIFVYVCGPWKNDNNKILERFKHCLSIGVNLSIQDPLYHGFDLLFPRDSPDVNNPDIVFASQVPQKPLIGICLVHSQYEYGEKQRHFRVKDAVYSYLANNSVSFIEIDTLYRNNNTGIKNSVSFENIISRLDVVISSRLHGLVFSLKKGVPVVAIDAIAGGAKLTNQVKALGWPVIINGEEVDKIKINDAVNRCLSASMRDTAAEIKKSALNKLDQIEKKFIQEITNRLQTINN